MPPPTPLLPAEARRSVPGHGSTRKNDACCKLFCHTVHTGISANAIHLVLLQRYECSDKFDHTAVEVTLGQDH